MTEQLSDRLYNLLPSIYRLRDASDGKSALRALLAVIETEYQALEDDIGGLYDDWFIETCAEWLVPYIGDLLGVGGLHPGSAESFSLRSYIANTLAYRRRKGTATMIEQLARDVTNWNARAVEFFELLGTTQYLNHLRPANLRTPDLRDANALELLDSPFDKTARTADVRHISNASSRPAPIGKYNIPNIGISLWRLQAYAVDRSHARQINPGFFTFNPLGYDQPLFNNPRTETEVTHLAEEINVPAPLRRRPLYTETESLRQALANGEQPVYLYFEPDEPVFQVFVAQDGSAIPAEQVLICDLSTWRNPPATKDYRKPDGTPESLPIAVAVDPGLGRIAFPSGVEPEEVRVSYSYGFSGDVGGGPYNRTRSVMDGLKGTITWQVGVSQSVDPVANQVFDNLTEAVQAWNNLSPEPGTVGVIAIMDSSTYQESLTGANVLVIPASCQLLIVAADWPAEEDPNMPGTMIRTTGMLAPDDVRPHLLGNISVRGTALDSDPNPGELALNGLLVEGQLTVLIGSLGALRFSHGTLEPSAGGLVVNASVGPGDKNNQLTASLERAICGPLTLADTVPHLSLVESIIDEAGSGAAVSAPGSDASIQSCTLFGTATLRSLEGSNSIFNGLLQIERRQAGCLRYSFVTADSHTPRRYRCQADLALAERADALGLDSPASLPAAERDLVFSRTRPAFSSAHYGDPEYAQLSLSSAPGIQNGADDGSEMGVFQFLKQPQRLANLHASLEDYLRFGLEAGVFFVT